MEEFSPSGSHMAYYQICHRKLWLYHQDIWLEGESELVLEGRLIHKTSYQQRPERYREVAIKGVKIDHFDPVEKLVREVKKSDKLEEAHIAQLKYYLYLLEESGVAGSRGLLEYPKMRHTHYVELNDEDRQQMPLQIAEIRDIANLERCPPVINKPYCKHCAYHDFCYIEEP
jgi:CRISPR-associated exonuclease Cas4